MIPWWWTIIAFFAGDMMGIVAISICVANGNREHKQEMKYIK